MALAGPSKLATAPSPVTLTSRPPIRSTWRRMVASWRSRIWRQRRSPRGALRSFEPARSVKSTVASTRSGAPPRRRPVRKLLDERDHVLLALGEVLALVARQQLHARVRDVLGEPPALRDGNGRVLEVQDERRARDERERVAHVDPADVVEVRRQHARARAGAKGRAYQRPEASFGPRSGTCA